VIFLIEYDRQSGRVVTFVAYDETSRALADNARLDLELRLNREGIEREVVLLEAATEEALRRTHGRYFEDLEGLSSTPPRDLAKHRRKVSEGPGEPE
jgi:hypothetical protein